jgi:hypothetical protein
MRSIATLPRLTSEQGMSLKALVGVLVPGGRPSAFQDVGIAGVSRPVLVFARRG